MLLPVLRADRKGQVEVVHAIAAKSMGAQQFSSTELRGFSPTNWEND